MNVSLIEKLKNIKFDFFIFLSWKNITKNINDYNNDDWNEIFDINVKSFFLLYNNLTFIDWAKIIVSSSIRSILPWRSILYSTSKAALNHMIKALSKNFKKHQFISLVLWPFFSNQTSNYTNIKKLVKLNKNNEFLDIENDITRQIINIIKGYQKIKSWNNLIIR